MDISKAIELVQVFRSESNGVEITGGIQNDARGGFSLKSSGAIFRYDSKERELLASSIVLDLGKSKGPKTGSILEALIFASAYDQDAMVGGEFEYGHLASPNKGSDHFVLLTRNYASCTVTSNDFNTRVRWLLRAAREWRTKVQDGLLVDIVSPTYSADGAAPKRAGTKCLEAKPPRLGSGESA